MSFMERARSLYERGEHVRTAFVLAEGIKRDPTREDALHWFLQVYVEDVVQPGLEQELVRIVETQPNGPQLLDLVCDEMRERQQFERLNFLERVRTLRERAARARDDLNVGAYPKRPSAPGPEAPDPVAMLHAAERARSAARGGARNAARGAARAAARGPDENPARTRPAADEAERAPVEAARPASVDVDGFDDEDLPPALAIPRPPRRPRRNRKRPQITAPQGVLDLEQPPRPARDDWGNFRGLAGEPTADASASSASAVTQTIPDTQPEPRPARRSRRDRRDRREPTVPPPSRPEPASASAPVPAAARAAAEEPHEETEPTDPGTISLAFEAPAPPRSEVADTAPDTTPNHTQRRFSRARWADRPTFDDGPGPGPALSGADDDEDDAIDVSDDVEMVDDDWSFGAPLSSVEDRHALDIDGTEIDEADLDADEAPFVPRRKRRATRAIERIESAPARVLLQTLVRLTTRKRGILLLAFVAVLGLLTAVYRSCAGMSESYLASADELLWAGTGDGLREALPLYEAYLPEGRSAHAERRDLAVALLAADYGDEAGALDYGVASALSVEGGAAAVLQQLANGNLAAARGEAEALGSRYANEWLASWARGRVAIAEQDWARAEAAMGAAVQAAPEQLLPLLGQLDLALRAADEERTASLLSQLGERAPDHPMIAIGRTLSAFGLDPLDARVANLEVVLPDPEAHTLSTRALALITYVRARQALAAMAPNRLARALRGLQSVDAATAGVRGQLLFAVSAALSHRIDEVETSLQRARNAAPSGSAAARVVGEVALTLYRDAQRPDLIVEAGLLDRADPLTRARILISLGEESRALSLLDDLMNQEDTRAGALRVLVDYHLRRGRGPRAAERGEMLTRPADRAYAQARLHLENGNYRGAVEEAENALRERSDDLDSLFVWCSAMASMERAELALERLNEASAHYLLPGLFDLHRLDVLVRSGRAPLESLSAFIDQMEASAPTATEALPILASAYQAVGDRERAVATANRLLEHEPHHAGMQALVAQ